MSELTIILLVATLALFAIQYFKSVGPFCWLSAIVSGAAVVAMLDDIIAGTVSAGPGSLMIVAAAYVFLMSFVNLLSLRYRCYR